MADSSFAEGDVSVQSGREGEGGGSAEETSSHSSSEQRIISQQLIDLRSDNQGLIAQLDSQRRDRRRVEEEAIEILRCVKAKYNEKLSTIENKYERQINDLRQQLEEMIVFKKSSDCQEGAASAVESQCGNCLQSMDSRLRLLEKIEEMKAIDEERDVVKKLARRCYDVERDLREKDLVEQLNSGIEAEKAKLESEVKKCLDQLASCQMKNSATSKFLTELVEKYEAVQLREKELMKDLKTQESIVVELCHTCESLEKARAETGKEASKFESLYIGKVDECEKLAAEAQKLQQRMTTLEDELNLPRQQLREAEDNRSAHKLAMEEKIRVESEKEKVPLELKYYQDKLANCQIQNSEASRKMADMKQKLLASEFREKKLLEEIDCLQSNVKTKGEALEKLRQSCDTHTKTNADLQTKALENEKLYIDEVGKCEILAADSKKFKERIATVDSELTSLHKELDAYKKRVKELEAASVKQDAGHKKEVDQMELQKQRLEAAMEEEKDVSRKCHVDVGSSGAFGAKKREMEAIDEESNPCSRSARQCSNGNCDGRAKDLVAHGMQLNYKGPNPPLTGLEKWKCYEELKREKDSLENRLKEAELNTAAYKIAIEEKIRIEAEKKKLQLELKDLEDQLASSHSEKVQISKSMADLAKKLEAGQLREKQLVEEIGGLKRDMEREESIVEKLRHTCDTLKKTSADIEKQASEYETLYFGQVGENEKLAAEAQNLRECITSLKDQLNSLHKDLDAYKKKVEELEEAIVRIEDDHKREVEQVQYEKQSLKAAFEQEKEVSDKYYEDIEYLRQTLEARRQEVESLQSCRSRLQQELVAVKEEAARHVTELNALKIENRELCDGLDTTMKKLEKSEARLGSAIIEFEAKEDQFDKEQIKMKETINQQLKLIDFLQNKSENKHKKQHWFGINSPSRGAPLSDSTNVVSIKDIESTLVKEQEKNQRLIQEIARTKEELGRCFQTIKAYETQMESLNSTASEQNVTSNLERITINKTRHLWEKSANKLDSLESQLSSPSAPPLFTVHNHDNGQMGRESTSSSLTTDNNELDMDATVNQTGNSSKRSQIQNKENSDTSEFSFTDSVLDDIGQY